MMVVVFIETGGIVSNCSAISGIFESSLIRGRSVSCTGINCIDSDTGADTIKKDGDLDVKVFSFYSFDLEKSVEGIV
jgi:hypothetical protein